MKKHKTPDVMKKPILAAALVFSLALTGTAQETSPNCFIKKNASWHDGSNWTSGSPPTQEDKWAIINLGHSAIVEQPVEEIISVGIGNGNTGELDGLLSINADFKVTDIGVAVHAASTGRVEHYAGVVSLKNLTLASINPDPAEATYLLEGGKLEMENLKVGVLGTGILSIKGTGEVVSVSLKAEIGPDSTLRFYGTAEGFPTLGLGTYTIEPGASLAVEGDATTKPGKYALILADEPLAGRFNVNLIGFDAGKASLLENEPGVVLEVK